MIFVTILTAIENELGVVVDEDDISADDCETVGSLIGFVEQ